MKQRLIIALAALALATAAAPDLFGQRAKKHKTKEKTFETVVRQDPKEYEGRYIGIEPDYVIEIRVAPDGRLSVSCLEDGHSVAVTNVRLEGARLTADKTYTDGRKGKLDGTFSNRILNGESAFGILVDGLDLQLDGGTTLDRVFYQRERKGAQSSSSVNMPEETVRNEIEAQYARLAQAVESKNFEAFQAVRTAGFSARNASGELQTSEQMAARARAMLQRIQPPIRTSNTIDSLTIRGDEAVVVVHQAFSRMQMIADQLRRVETTVTQRETWVRTPEGWKLNFVDDVHDPQTFVDGKRVDPNKPYNPNDPPYDPRPSTSKN